VYKFEEIEYIKFIKIKRKFYLHFNFCSCKRIWESKST